MTTSKQTKNRQILALAKKVRKLLGKKENWCQCSNARDVEGVRTEPRSREATQFCLRGAAMHLSKSAPIVRTFLEEFSVVADPDSFKGIWSAINYNDSHRHPTVIKALDKTIKHLTKLRS